MLSRSVRVSLGSFAALSVLTVVPQLRASSRADGIPAPEAFLGFRVGEDKKLARWEKIVEYMRIVANGSDRVRLRELGKTTNKNPFILLEIASADTLKNLERYKQLERKLYFQGGAPADAERDDIFRSGKDVVLVTSNIQST
jgi:hypothetical protein